VATKDIKASAQGLILLATLGVGKFISSQLAGPVQDFFTITSDGQALTNWTGVFLVPVGVTLVGAAAFLLLFSERKDERQEERMAGPPDALPARKEIVPA